jgi:ABC-2 type transport system permease protein
MTNMLSCEWMKLKKSVALKVLFLLMVIAGVSLSLFGMTIKMTGWNAMIESLSDCSLIAIIGSIMAGLFICSDFENRTIQECIMCGNSHFSILASKTIVYIISMFVICLPFTLITTVALSYKNGFGVELTTDLLLKLVEMIITVSFAYGSLLMLCILVSFLAQKTGVSIAINVIAVGFGGSIIYMISSLLGPIGKIISYSPFGLYSLALQPKATGIDYLTIVLISCLWIALLLIITGRLFYKKELK